MDTIIRSTESSDLQAAADANLAAFWSAYGRGDGCVLRELPGAVWYYTGIPSPLFNGAVCASIGTEGVKPVVEGLRAEITRRGAPAFWWVGPSANPNRIGVLLAEYGLHAAGETPGMAVDLNSLDGESPACAGLSIERVKGAEMQELWGRIAGIGSGFPSAAAEALARLEASLSDPLYTAQHRYVGYLDAAPVATSAMVLEGGVAGIYAVATLPEARRKGIGRAMTLMPLLEARALGYRVGVLQASEMGYPVYQKMGFRDICAYKLYLQS